MSHIEIIEERCKGCLLCTDACPKQLIRQSTKFNKQGYKVSEFIEGGELEYNQGGLLHRTWLC